MPDNTLEANQNQFSIYNLSKSLAPIAAGFIATRLARKYDKDYNLQITNNLNNIQKSIQSTTVNTIESDPGATASVTKSLLGSISYWLGGFITTTASTVAGFAVAKIVELGFSCFEPEIVVNDIDELTQNKLIRTADIYNLAADDEPNPVNGGNNNAQTHLMKLTDTTPDIVDVTGDFENYAESHDCEISGLAGETDNLLICDEY